MRLGSITLGKRIYNFNNIFIHHHSKFIHLQKIFTEKRIQYYNKIIIIIIKMTNFN